MERKKHREKANRSTDSIIHEDMCFIVKCFFTAEVVESKCIRLCTPNCMIRFTGCRLESLHNQFASDAASLEPELRDPLIYCNYFLIAFVQDYFRKTHKGNLIVSIYHFRELKGKSCLSICNSMKPIKSTRL